MKADRFTADSVPPVVEAFDRLLLAFSSVGLVAIVLGLSTTARATDLWIMALQAVFLSACVVVALCRGRLLAGWRSAAYSLCFSATAGAEVLRSGLSGNTLLLAFLAVLLAAVTPAGRVRQGVYGFGGLVLGGVFAATQEVRGAHFLSHDLFSLVICWYAALAVDWLMFRKDFPVPIEKDTAQ